MSGNGSISTSGRGSSKPSNVYKNVTPFRTMPRTPLTYMSAEGSGVPGAAAAIVTLILFLAYVGLQIYILYYTFKLERIGCECARDFRLTYAQVYIIMTFAVYLSLGVMETLTDVENEKSMAVAKGILNLIMFVAGIFYVVFVWQYISRLRRIKCACSTSLARDVWEVVNYINAAILFLTIIMALIAVVGSVALYTSLKAAPLGGNVSVRK